MNGEVSMLDSVLNKIRSTLTQISNDPSSVSEGYWSIADCLLTEVREIGLDEDINNLVRFAVGVSEMLSPRMTLRVLNTGVKHWDRSPLVYKVGAKNSDDSDIRSDEKMKIAMMGVIAFQLSYDDEYHAVSAAIESFEKSNSLWTQDDYLG